MSDKLQTLLNVLNSLSGSPVVVALEKPQNKPNCIVYNVISEQPIHSIDKTLLAEKTHVQLDIWGDSMTKVMTLTTAVKSKLDINNTDFILCYEDNGFLVKDSESNLFRYVIDFYIY
jgi:hypothetical protein